MLLFFAVAKNCFAFLAEIGKFGTCFFFHALHERGAYKAGRVRAREITMDGENMHPEGILAAAREVLVLSRWEEFVSAWLKQKLDAEYIIKPGLHEKLMYTIQLPEISLSSSVEVRLGYQCRDQQLCLIDLRCAFNKGFDRMLRTHEKQLQRLAFLAVKRIFKSFGDMESIYASKKKLTLIRGDQILIAYADVTSMGYASGFTEESIHSMSFSIVIAANMLPLANITKHTYLLKPDTVVHKLVPYKMQQKKVLVFLMGSKQREWVHTCRSPIKMLSNDVVLEIAKLALADTPSYQIKDLVDQQYKKMRGECDEAGSRISSRGQRRGTCPRCLWNACHGYVARTAKKIKACSFVW